MVPNKTRIFYGIGSIAEGVKETAFNVFLLFYYNQVLGLSGSLAGIALFIALCFDAVTDPLAGFLSDGTRSRMGRRRPWLLWSAIPISLSFYMMWNPPASFDESEAIVYMLIGVMLFYSTMTAAFVPHQSLAAEISEDPTVGVAAFAMDADQAEQLWALSEAICGTRLS